MAYDLGTAHGKIELEYTGKRDVDAAERDMDRVGDKSKDTDRELKKLGKTLGTVFGGIARGGAMAGLAVGLTNAAAGAASLGIQLAGIVPSLVSISSLSAGLPALLVGAAASVGVLKAAFAGVGEALENAFDPENAAKFNEAIEKLSPSARAFATAVRDAAPGLRDLQQGLQEAFFSSSFLAEQVPKAARALDSLRPVLFSLTDQFGELTRRVANFALSADSVQFMSNSIINFREGLAGATEGIVPLLAGLRAVGEVGGTLLPRLGNAIGDVATRFGAWLEEIAANGQLFAWIEQAIATLKTLGEIAGNIGGILTSIFTVAEETGGGLLNTLAELTEAADDFLSSAEGQNALASLFEAALEVARQLAPVFSTLAGSLVPALADALGRLALEVGPALVQTVEALAPAFGPVANAIADVLSAVAPLLPPLAQLVALIATALAGGLSALASELGPVISLLAGAFTDALTTLAPVVSELVAQALPLAAAFGADLAAAVAPLVPQIVALAQAFADALLPVLPELVGAAQELLPVILELATVFAGSLAEGIQALIPYIPTLVNLMVSMTTTMWAMLGAGLRVVTWILQFGDLLRQLPGIVAAAVGSFVNFLVNGFQSALTTVMGIGGRIVAWFSELPGRVGGFMGRLPGIIGQFIVAAMHRLAFEVGAGIGRAITFFATFPGKAVAAIKNLPQQIGAVVVSAMARARQLFSAGINTVVNIARTLGPRTRGVISNLISILGSIASQAWQRLRNQFSNGVTNATSVARGLGPRIRSAVGNLGGLLVGAGRDAVMGLVRGLRGAIGAAINAAASVGRSVINGIKSTLRIGSPSRVMFEFGEWTSEGLALGILDQIDLVKRAALSLANTVIQPTIGLNNQNAARNASVPMLAGTRPANRLDVESWAERIGGNRTYVVRLGEKTMSEIVVDALTGKPVEVKKATDEGARRVAWAGSGR
jgi:phage-related protein